MAKGVAEDIDRPLTWAESGQSILKLNIRHLWLCGVWPLPGCWLYDAYAIMGLIVGAVNAVESAVSLYFYWGDMEETTLLLTSSVSNGCGTVKMAVFMRNHRQYFAMARRVEMMMSMQNEYTSEDPALDEIQQVAHKRGYRLTLFWTLLMFSQYFVWYPMPFYAHPGERRLPFAQHAWDNNTNQYALSYFLQCAASARGTQLSWSLDLLFVSVMLLVAAQLEILTRRITSLKEESHEGKAAAVGEKSGKGMAANIYDNMYENLRLCIETHQKLLSFIRYLDDTMSSVVMIQFCVSVLLVCVALFQATYSTDSTAVLRCALYLPMPGSQVFLYCWAAHSVTEQAEAVSLAAYSCSWVGTARRIKQSLRIIISRAQKPLVMTAGHIYPIDREAFVSLVNASYSYYALLGQMSKR
ncbi:odorant receptor Or2-like [Schistocerca cancellata]|uniref:odorant receptor Or2-like n=1 Tax=Schistocerca cancellata TaxID=274614 RepID=UPI00211761E6|nr:odorant receptor Or2-like [Schistocerca cancellata]